MNSKETTGPDAPDDRDRTPLEQAIHGACIDVLEDPLRSDVVNVAALEDDPRVQEASSVSESAIRTQLGTILTNSEYATKVARNKYRIELDE